MDPAFPLLHDFLNHRCSSLHAALDARSMNDTRRRYPRCHTRRHRTADASLQWRTSTGWPTGLQGITSPTCLTSILQSGTGGISQRVCAIQAPVDLEGRPHALLLGGDHARVLSAGRHDFHQGSGSRYRAPCWQHTRRGRRGRHANCDADELCSVGAMGSPALCP